MTTQTSANTLTFTSAFYHPEPTVRDRLRGIVDQWVDSLEPRYSEKEIREFIANEGGTPLEPFVLEKSDMDMAVRLARAAFSEKMKQTRFRLVSRETIGREGGLVITNNLKSYYAERYVHGKHKRSPKAGISFFPAYTPDSSKHQLVRLMKTSSRLLVDEEGFNIITPWPHDLHDSGMVARELQQNSKISNVEKTFDQLGLRVEADLNRVEVRTGSAESQIKLTAHMMNHDTMVLYQGTGSEFQLKAHIALDISDEDETPLRTTFTTSGKEWDWLKIDWPQEIKLGREDIMAISKWLPPHDSWVDQLWGSQQ